VTFQIRFFLSLLLKEGHRVLIKDQKTRLVLANTIDPEVYFKAGYTILRNLGSTIEYEYLDDENGIYQVQNGILERSTELQNYQNIQHRLIGVVSMNYLDFE
jgi:hypothetical protein